MTRQINNVLNRSKSKNKNKNKNSNNNNNNNNNNRKAFFTSNFCRGRVIGSWGLSV